MAVSFLKWWVDRVPAYLRETLYPQGIVELKAVQSIYAILKALFKRTEGAQFGS
jgi:hypothetical protein